MSAPASFSAGSSGLPKFLRCSTFDARLKSYEFCDVPTIKMKARDLSEAGFFYPNPKTMKPGQDNQIICFHCGGPIRDWRGEDVDPWVLHAQFYPACQFVLDFKGDSFIKSVVNRAHAAKEAVMCDDGISDWGSMTPIRNQSHLLKSSSSRNDSGFCNVTIERTKGLSISNDVETELHQNVYRSSRYSSLSVAEFDRNAEGFEEADKCNRFLERELEKKAAIVKSLTEKLNTLRSNSELCSTQLSEEVACKQQIFDDLYAKLYLKKSVERQDRINLMQFRREREEVIFQLKDQFTKAQEQFNKEKKALSEKTEATKKHLDNLEVAHNDLVEKYEDKKKELLKLTSEIDSLSAENHMKQEGISKLKTIIAKHKLTTMERLAEMAKEIEKKNAMIAKMKQKSQEPSNE